MSKTSRWNWSDACFEGRLYCKVIKFVLMLIYHRTEFCTMIKTAVLFFPPRMSHRISCKFLLLLSTKDSSLNPEGPGRRDAPKKKIQDKRSVLQMCYTAFYVCVSCLCVSIHMCVTICLQFWGIKYRAIFIQTSKFCIYTIHSCTLHAN